MDLVFDAARSLIDQSFGWTSRIDSQRKAMGRLLSRVMKGAERTRRPLRRRAAHAVQLCDQSIPNLVGGVVAAARNESRRESEGRDAERCGDGGVCGRLASLSASQQRVAGCRAALWRSGIAARARRYQHEQSGDDAGGIACNRRRRSGRANARDQGLDAGRQRRGRRHRRVTARRSARAGLAGDDVDRFVVGRTASPRRFHGADGERSDLERARPGAHDVSARRGDVQPLPACRFRRTRLR